MKLILLFTLLSSAVVTRIAAQSRVAIAPTYWFSYNPYSYQLNYTFNGSTSQTPIAGHDIVSAVGLTLRYRFTPHWDVSLGGFYYRDTNHIKTPQSPYNESTSFTSKGWQLPVMINYRLTEHRLSPYFSAGAIFSKSTTFTERPLTTDGVVGVGIIYRINSDLLLLLQPTASYSFYRPASDDFYSFTRYSSYSLGIQTQLIWYF
ncbi:outer membrane beta-barrel protein [Spirosoma koreense]